MAGIELWVAAHRPADARPDNAFVGQPAGLLLVAEARSEELGHGHVSDSHLWLALAEIEPVTAVLASMGITRAELGQAMDVIRHDQQPPRRRTAMTPAVQRTLEEGHRRRSATPASMQALDVAGALVRDPEGVFRYFYRRRGLDFEELERRLSAAAEDPAVVTTFEPRSLTGRPARRRRVRRPRALAGVALMANGLGHDPWKRLGWGAAFAHTADGRDLVVDGEQWFFRVDADGFFVRTLDGRPVGYRYRIDPPSRVRRGQRTVRPVNGFVEVLPMPPPNVAYWPDYRYQRDVD
jgi:hypothetical protein